VVMKSAGRGAVHLVRPILAASAAGGCPARPRP
jgi:hypothetical protein